MADYPKSDGKEGEVVVGMLVEPSDGGPMGILEIPGDPDDGFGLDASQVRKDLAQVSVIGGFKLVLDEDAITCSDVLGNDVDREIVDSGFRIYRLQLDPNASERKLMLSKSHGVKSRASSGHASRTAVSESRVNRVVLNGASRRFSDVVNGNFTRKGAGRLVFA